jgi:N-acetylglucosaminyldiphosphoundecaprenol N-acetyl-beta-D-mannosaminyltransferase
MKEQDWQQLAGSISASGATVVWIGLSTPKQERFAMELAKRVSVHLIITVGAAFDFHTGLQPQAPHFMQRAGLEWFFRLCTEPNRLWKRYLEIVPKFVFYGMQDLLRSVLKKNA